MNDFFPATNVRRDPEDIDLVLQIELQQLSDWLAWHFQGLPEQYMKQIRDLEALRNGLSPIFGVIQEGDTLWLGRSRRFGPLYGHEGIALVRDGRPIVYIRALNH
ncbi:MAG TPA: hypothetical protein VGJ56_21865 [Reyranella sp.]